MIGYIACLLGGAFIGIVVLLIILTLGAADDPDDDLGDLETAAIIQLRTETRQRVTELLEANNRDVDARRAVARALREEQQAHQQTRRQWEHLRAELATLSAAGRALYMAGRWTCNREVDEAGLWTALRDALLLAPGTATAAGVAGFDEDHRVERNPGRRGSIKRSHRAEGRNFLD